MGEKETRADRKYTSVRILERSARMLRSVCAARGMHIAEAADEAVTMYAERHLPADMIAHLSQIDSQTEKTGREDSVYEK